MKFRIKYTRPRTYVTAYFDGRPIARASVDNAAVERELRRRGMLVGFSLGGIWKAVKKVAKKTGISKVIKLAKKTLPLAAKILPPPANLAALGAGAAIGTASDLLHAAAAKKQGNRAREALYVARAATRGKAYEAIAGPQARRRVLRGGARLYRIMVQPT